MNTLFGYPIVYDNDEALPIPGECSVETTLEFGSPFECQHIFFSTKEGEDIGSIMLYALSSYMPKDKYKELVCVLENGGRVPEWCYDYVILAFKDLHCGSLM